MAQKLATPRILEVEKERLKHSWKSLALPLPSQVMLLSYINKVDHQAERRESKLKFLALFVQAVD